MIDINALKMNFNSRNIEFEYFENRVDLLNAIDRELHEVDTVGIGNSKTLKALKISDRASNLHKLVYDKTMLDSKAEITKIKKLALTADLFISSSNAISKDGIIVNVDHSGNRVAALTYGPERVLIIVSTNKLVGNEKEAIKRALRVATPLNAKRAEISSPCRLGLPCTDCKQDVRVCNYISVIRGQYDACRMKVLMLDEKLGF